jgi:NAD(P)-dependent dehydrogenase (short-subunit alcohol dehydrogenase family)
MLNTVFISGADKGLGFSLVARFLRAGFQAFAGAHLTESGLALLEKQYPETLTIVPLDVSDMESICTAATQVARSAPALDILINNAGIHLEQDGITELEALNFADGRLEKTLAVNTLGPLRMAQKFYPLLARGRRKLLINVSSEAGSIMDCGRQGEFAYCMSKSALNMQSKLLQNQLGPQGFKVLAVHPGWMRTDMGGSTAAISADEAAEGIFALADRNWSPNDPIYLDYRGNALRW